MTDPSLSALQTIADNLTVIGLLLIIVVAFVRGWVVPAQRLTDWQTYAEKAEKRAERAEEELRQNIQQLAQVARTAEVLQDLVSILLKERQGLE